MQTTTQTTLEINLEALADNYAYLRSKLKTSTKMLAVVKAFGYGSDAVAVAQELVKLGTDYFAVAYSNEGEQLRDAAIETPILVLHPLPVNFQVILDRCLEPSIYSLKMLKEFVAFAETEQQQNYPIHLKFNTGLNRLGFNTMEIPEMLTILKGTKSLKVKSIFSHLAASEDPEERDFTEGQLKSFAKLSKEVINQLEYKPLLHTLNTSGVLNFPEAQYDMVRTGIGLYGFGNSVSENKNLKPVATLKTVISQIHHLKSGETLGYNRAFKAATDITTATLPIGHADGISRAYGNGVGWVTIQGQKAPIQGNVCMDMIMVDITGIVCKEGDEVIIFDTAITADDLSDAVHSISYELLTAISQRIKRVVYRKQQ